ncbi:MAG: hypothetical protein Q7R33_01780 [Nitrosarchaeum sp.]|nr:hypothetical protein [Nitrosarchaeum sp.]
MAKQNKQYFYTERNQTQRYLYCTLCGIGPFKQNEEGQKIFYKAGDKDPMYYCENCNRIHAPKIKFVKSAVMGPRSIDEESFTFTNDPKDVLKQEQLGKIDTIFEGNCYVVILKDSTKRLICCFAENVEKFISDLNSNKIRIPHISIPVESAYYYKRGCDSKSEAEKYIHIIKNYDVKQKQALIKNYHDTINKVSQYERA